MTNLRNKSELNLEAASKLHELCLYPSVVHCAYYACFQLAKFMLVTFHGVTEAELDPKKTPSRTHHSEGSHERLISLTTEKLKSLGRVALDFNNQMVELKKLRHESDYSDKLIDSSKSAKAIEQSRRVIAIIKNLK